MSKVTLYDITQIPSVIKNSPVYKELIGESQHHLPGTQKLFNEFPTNNVVTENGKELYCPKGGRGLEGEPGVPTDCNYKFKLLYI